MAKKKALVNGSHIISRGEDLIKNPLPIIENMGGASLKQTKIILKVLEQIQERYTFYLDHRDDMQKNGQYGLFRDDEFEDKDGELVKYISIPLSEFKIAPSQYSELEQAAKMLSSIVAPVPELIKGDLVTMWRPLFSAGIPTHALSNVRKSYLLVEIKKSMADKYFHTRKGYVEHLATLAYNCRRSYTVHLLDNMYGWFKVWPTHKIKYSELRKLLGMTSRDEKGNITDQKYPRFKDFEKRVLESAKSEADNVLMKGLSDFSFTYEKDCEKGEPEYITFSIVTEITPTPTEETAKSPTLSDECRAMWDNFIAMATNFVGEEVMNKYYGYGAFRPIDITSDTVLIHINGGALLRNTILDTILRPCSKEWVSVFGDRRCRFSLA